MKSPAPFKLATLALGLAVLAGSSAAQAQTYYLQQPYWWGPTYHNFAFTSVSNVQDINASMYILFQGSVQFKVGFSFVGRTAAGQSYTVSVLGPGGNIIGSRVGATEAAMMESVVKAFRDNPQHYSVLRLHNTEKYPYTYYGMTTSSKMTIEVANPAAATDSDLNGGLIELVVHGGGDFYAEAKIRRQGSCGNTYKRSRIGALRNVRAFILNDTTVFTTVTPLATAGDIARLLVSTAVDGVPFLDVSGATKLESNDPYHLSGGDSCLTSTYIIGNYSLVQING